MDTFTEKEIREALADTGVAATLSQYTKSNKGAGQENAELVMRTLAAALTDPLDLEYPDAYGEYVAEEFHKDVDGEGILTDAAFAAAAPTAVGFEQAVTDGIVRHALDCAVMDERDWLADQEQAYKDEQADRAYDQARMEGRWPHRG